jgi:hypothetical protein
VCVCLLRGIRYYPQKRHMKAQFKWTTNYEAIVNKFLFRIVGEIVSALESPPPPFYVYPSHNSQKCNALCPLTLATIRCLCNIRSGFEFIEKTTDNILKKGIVASLIPSSLSSYFFPQSTHPPRPTQQQKIKRERIHNTETVGLFFHR